MQSADRPTRLQWNLNFINIKVADNVDLDLQICILSPCSSDGKLRGGWFKADLHTVSTFCECHTWTSIFNNRLAFNINRNCATFFVPWIYLTTVGDQGDI